MKKSSFREYMTPILRKDLKEKQNKLKEVKSERKGLKKANFNAKIRKHEAIVEEAKNWYKFIKLSKK